ncbi:MAG: hypothetical protein R2762_11495 [Bryobacteraceae bacterium]
MDRLHQRVARVIVDHFVQPIHHQHQAAIARRAPEKACREMQPFARKAAFETLEEVGGGVIGAVLVVVPGAVEQR